MKSVIIVQARTGSSRFPNKVMREINGIPIIELLLKRLTRSKKTQKIVVATTKEKKDDLLFKFIKKIGFDCYRGSEKDVLKRYFEAAKIYKADYVVRVTGDCPLIDPQIIDECLKIIQLKKADYVSNIFPPTFPDGLDVEVISFSTLKKINRLANSFAQREGVTKYIRDNKKNFKIINFKRRGEDLSKLRLTVDEEEDLTLVKKIFEYYRPKIYFNLNSIISLYKKNKNLFSINSHIPRNEGSKLSDGQKLWKRAQKVILGGNMLLSKNPNMFLPTKWPTYFSKTKGYFVWDLENKKYSDLSLMSVGTNILGYSHNEVDNAVKKVLKLGNMSTLNCSEEVELAEKLLSLHPWFDVVKFARTGGEANSIAIRIARSNTKNTNVAFCGYHGWHDWYLSSNIKNKSNLDAHLLKGLNPLGVPKELANTSFPFHYNDYKTLEKLVDKRKIGVIKMEVCRSESPNVKFLRKVRELCDRKGIVLIFDECSSGFRECLGGLHKKIGVYPDMAIFGKALGNGYAITAILGKKHVMDAAKKSFISSTFWTERIGPAAALKTLEVMERTKSWNKITFTGNKIINIWKKLSNRYKIRISVNGIPSLAKFQFLSKKHLSYKTFITQELLKKKILGGNGVYSCTSHDDKILRDYEYHLDKIFYKISNFENGKKDINQFLETPLSSNPFSRLN